MGRISVRHITVHLMRSAAIRSVNCAGIPTGLTTSSGAPVPHWLRMRQAIVRPLNSMLPIFMKRPLIAHAICATCSHARPAEIGRNETRVLSLMFVLG